MTQRKKQPANKQQGEASKNLDIWQKLERTELEYTKDAKVNGQNITSINGTYAARKATAEFGPIGIGWGYEILEDRFDNGGPIYDKERNEVGRAQIHTIKIELWYKRDGQTGTIQHFGHTPFVYSSKYGVSIDSDPAKKSLTDAIKKCLSMLGFSADIYLGQMENPDYLEELQTERAERHIEKAATTQIKKREDLDDWLKESAKNYSLISKVSVLKHQHRLTCDIYRTKAAQVEGVNIDKALARLAELYYNRALELAPAVNLICEECGTGFVGKLGQECPEEKCKSKKNRITE